MKNLFVKLFKYKVLKDIFPKVLVKRYAFDLEILANAHKNGFKIVEAPIELNFNGDSKLKFMDIFHIALDTMAVFYRMYIKRYYDNPD